MVRLRRIPAIRAANLLTLTIAIPYGILLLLFLLFFGAFYMTTSGGGPGSTVFVGGATLIAGLVGWAVAMLFLWISIAISCALYNAIAGRFGGIELEFRTIPPTY